MKKGHERINLSSYKTSDAPSIRVGSDKDPGWVHSVAHNEWEKFSKLTDKPKVEDDYFVGKGFTVFYRKPEIQLGSTVIIRK